MVSRCENVILVANLRKKKNLSLKFIIENGKLYAYNMFLARENRKKVEIIKINNVKVEDFFDKIELNDLYSVDKMNELGINTTDSYICSFVEDEKIVEYDILSEDSSDEIFYKKFEINNIIDGNINEITSETPSSGNVMLEYASTNAKALLSILKDMSISENDKNKLDSILQQFHATDNNYINIQNNLDMIFLSTQLLILGEKVEIIPETVENIFKNFIGLNIIQDELNEENNAILTEGQVDYKKVVKMIRNCIAHSNYKIFPSGYIKFYNSGKNKMKFFIHKSHIMTLFNHLYNHYYLCGCLPVILNGNAEYDRNSFTSETLLDYLIKSIELYGTQKPKLKRFESLEEQKMMDSTLISNALEFASYTPNYNFDTGFMLRSYEKRIQKHLRDDSTLDSKKLSYDDIKYILVNIYDMNAEYFYQLGKTAQIEVINQLILQRYSKEYYLFTNLQGIVDSKHFSNETLLAKSSDYIKYKAKLELLILSIINNLLLFCYNQNKSVIEARSIRFSEQIYKDYLDSREKKFYELSKEASDYQFVYNLLLNVSSSHLIGPEDYISVEENIRKTKNGLVKTKNDIDNANAILTCNADDEIYRNINIQILNRIRDCLAHGRLSIEISNINNIMEAELKILDEYEGTMQFSTSLKFGELIDILNEPTFIKSLLNDNQNFKKNSL